MSERDVSSPYNASEFKSLGGRSFDEALSYIEEKVRYDVSLRVTQLGQAFHLLENPKPDDFTSYWTMKWQLLATRVEGLQIQIPPCHWSLQETTTLNQAGRTLIYKPRNVTPEMLQILHPDVDIRNKFYKVENMPQYGWIEVSRNLERPPSSWDNAFSRREEDRLRIQSEANARDIRVVDHEEYEAVHSVYTYIDPNEDTLAPPQAMTLDTFMIALLDEQNIIGKNDDAYQIYSIIRGSQTTNWMYKGKNTYPIIFHQPGGGIAVGYQARPPMSRSGFVSVHYYRNVGIK